MDIGHVRNVTWAKDNDEKKWVAYNRLRGQYMSALEHSVPERFFNDPNQCNLQGATNPTPGLPECPQGISAVKALGIAAAQGQRIYTITQKVYNDNPNIVNTALSAHSYDTQNRVQQSLDAGYDVTIHEQPITESGWTGAGYTAIDPTTGAGAYTIEGGANGAALLAGLALGIATGAIFVIAAVAAPAWPFLAGVGLGVALVLIASIAIYNLRVWSATEAECFWQGFGTGLGVFGLVIALSQLAALLAAASGISTSVVIKAVLELFVSIISAAIGVGVGAVSPSRPIDQCW